jgi:predicted metal-dependent peptidase
MQDKDVEDRTFAVVVDTSGSVSTTQLGLSLGAIVSYANSKDVRYIRIVFCDADAYDQGYMTPDELAGRVKVAGRGGTILQPAIDLIENAKDFPTNGPILIITDGMIENRLHVHRDHAFLLPKGNRLPFKPKGDVFYFK